MDQLWKAVRTGKVKTQARRFLESITDDMLMNHDLYHILDAEHPCFRLEIQMRVSSPKPIYSPAPGAQRMSYGAGNADKDVFVSFRLCPRE